MSEMKLKNRRSFSAEFKPRIVVQIVSGHRSVAELSREHQIKDSVLGNWRDQFLERAPELFGTSASPQGQVRIAELERELGRQHLELEILKKASKRLV